MEYCDYKTKKISTLKTHWRRYHQEKEGSRIDAKRSIEDPEKYPFECIKCHRRLATKGALSKHNNRGCHERQDEESASHIGMPTSTHVSKKASSGIGSKIRSTMQSLTSNQQTRPDQEEAEQSTSTGSKIYFA